MRQNLLNFTARYYGQVLVTNNIKASTQLARMLTQIDQKNS